MKCQLFLVVLLLFCDTAFSAGEKPTTPFNIIGYIQSFKLCDPAYNATPCNKDDPRAAATMKVNGITVIIPENLKIIMPGTYLTAQDVFKGEKGKATGSVLPQSGLALEDTYPPGKPFIPFTAEISGNIAKTDPTAANSKVEYIAGLVNISQGVLQTSAGYIRDIDYAKGELLVTPDISNSTNQVRVQLNDPPLKADGTGPGRFSKGSKDAKDDNRFMVDQGNPTVHAMTGYPVCIPTGVNGDPRCPMTNRKMDGTKFSRRYTIGSKVAETTNQVPVADAPLCTTCDSRFMVPLVAGDYVIFSGIWIDDSTNPANPTGYISAYSLEANLGIYTSPGENPAYVAIEESHWGTGGIPFDNLPQETGPGKTAVPGQNLVTRFFIVGFTTDPSRNVEVIALDVDSVTGDEKTPPRVLSVISPEATAPVGRFRRTVEQSVFLPPTREIQAHIVGTPGTTNPKAANDLEWGQYTAPIGEYLFPEGRAWGSPQVPMNFENLCFLAQGAGSLDTLGRDNAPGAGCTDATCQLKQLKPWPDSGHAVTDPQAACNNAFTP